MPGLVDHHVHVNEPGNTEWEGFITATRSAASGGFTTIVDMPLNSIPVTTTVDALKEKMKSMEDKLWVDTALLGGVVPGNQDQLEDMINLGVVGFKCFMIHSGLDEFEHVKEEDIRKAMEVFKKVGKDKTVFMFHAEIDCCGCVKTSNDDDVRSYQRFLNSRPREFENEAIKLVIKLAKEYDVKCHIVHLSSSDAIELIKKAKDEGVPITAETTFHYLYFSSENIQDGKPLFKCCPPIREESNRNKLWEALKSGIITQVVSDHSPSPPSLKNLTTGDLSTAWGGIASVGLGIPVIWTEARKRNFTPSDLARWMAKNTSELVGLSKTKGSIEVGKDADFVIWDPDEEVVITEEFLQFKHKISPYLNEKLYGSVKETYLRGKKIFSQGKFVDKPFGKRLVPNNN